jgi:hypothetical protein
MSNLEVTEIPVLRLARAFQLMELAKTGKPAASTRKSVFKSPHANKGRKGVNAAHYGAQ